MITSQHSNTNISYTFEGTPVDEKKHGKTTYRVTIESWKDKELAKIVKTGRFTYHVPDMWPDKCWGYPERVPGYDIVCKVEHVERVTETKTWIHEVVGLESISIGIARDALLAR